MAEWPSAAVSTMNLQRAIALPVWAANVFVASIRADALPSESCMLLSATLGMSTTATEVPAPPEIVMPDGGGPLVMPLNVSDITARTRERRGIAWYDSRVGFTHSEGAGGVADLIGDFVEIDFAALVIRVVADVPQQ